MVVTNATNGSVPQASSCAGRQRLWRPRRPRACLLAPASRQLRHLLPHTPARCAAAGIRHRPFAGRGCRDAGGTRGAGLPGCRAGRGRGGGGCGAGRAAQCGAAAVCRVVQRAGKRAAAGVPVRYCTAGTWRGGGGSVSASVRRQPSNADQGHGVRNWSDPCPASQAFCMPEMPACSGAAGGSSSIVASLLQKARLGAPAHPICYWDGWLTQPGLAMRVAFRCHGLLPCAGGRGRGAHQ